MKLASYSAINLTTHEYLHWTAIWPLRIDVNGERRSLSEHSHASLKLPHMMYFFFREQGPPQAKLKGGPGCEARNPHMYRQLWMGCAGEFLRAPIPRASNRTGSPVLVEAKY